MRRADVDVFGVHQQVVEGYRAFTRSFVDIRDERVRAAVDEAIDGGLLWPSPWVQLNPSFAQPATPDDLVRAGVLHPETANVFRRKRDRGDRGEALPLYQHQVEAIMAAREGANYVLTTGTGSGKSLAYLVPIVDHVLREGAGTGVRGLIVYPMNALANSQFNELEKFVCHGYAPGPEPLRYDRYTGQERDEQREAILTHPPDILSYHLALPTHAQKLIEYCHARPDFLYGPDYLAIFVDGSAHDPPEQRQHDAEVDARFDDLGYTVLRLRYDQRDRWLALLQAHPSVFGTPHPPAGAP